MTSEPAKPARIDTEGYLAIGSLLLFSAIFGTLLFQVVPAANKEYVFLMLGALIGVVKDTFGRYFQATKGAQEQRKDAAAVAQTLADTVATASASPAADVKLKPGESVEVAAAPAPIAPEDKPPWERT